MPIGEENISGVEVFDNDIVSFCERLSELAREASTSFEAVIYPRDGGDIDFIDLVFLCEGTRCSATVFAVKADGNGIGSGIAESPSIIGSILASSALNGSYAEVSKKSVESTTKGVNELSNKFGINTEELGDNRVNMSRFMAKIINSAKVIGTESCPADSESALNLFLKSLMASACFAHSDRVSSVLADEIRGGPAGSNQPSMILVSRARTGSATATTFLGFSGDEVGIATELRDGEGVRVLEGFQAIRAFIDVIKERGNDFTSYCTVLFGYSGMGQY